MRKTILCLLVGFVVAAHTDGSRAAEVRPRIRAVTAFVEIDPSNYAAKISEAQKFLAAAKDALNKAGFEGAGGRITTQPFPQYTKGMSSDDAVSFIGKLREAASKERSGLNIASAMVHDNDDPAAVSLLIDILSKVSVNANLIMADEQGIHWNAVRQTAKVIKQLSERSPHGRCKLQLWRDRDDQAVWSLLSGFVSYGKGPRVCDCDGGSGSRRRCFPAVS